MMRRLLTLLLLLPLVVGVVCAQDLVDWTPYDLNRHTFFTDGLIAWFPGLRHVAGGATWYDWVSANAAVLTGGAIWGTPTCAGADTEVRFDGVNDYATAGFSPSTTNIGLKSVIARIRPTAWPTTNGIGHIVEKRDPNGGWAFNINNNGISGNPTAGLSFIQDFSTTSANGGISSVITLGNCYTVGITHDPVTSSSNLATFYVNGVAFAATSIGSNGSGTVTSDATSNLELGGQPDGTRNFVGAILDVRMYNRMLTAAEMLAIHLSFLGPSPYAGMFVPQSEFALAPPVATAPLMRRAPHVY